MSWNIIFSYFVCHARKIYHGKFFYLNTSWIILIQSQHLNIIFLSFTFSTKEIENILLIWTLNSNFDHYFKLMNKINQFVQDNFMQNIILFIIKFNIILIVYKIEMYRIDMAMYEQMGFTKEQVTKAYEFSQKNNVDIFDALQYLQKRQNPNQRISPQQKNKTFNKTNDSSILFPFKNVNLSNYEIIYSTKSSRMNLPGKKVDLRQEFSPVGLLNVYNCCYLNSLLQCYFLSSDLMKYIFEAEPLSSLENLQSKTGKIKTKRIQNQYNLLHTLKEIFSKMCLTSRKYIDPTQVLRNLVDSVGQKVEYGDEKDLFETNISIIERLNQCLLYTKRYFKAENQQSNDDKTRDDLLSISSNGKSIINKSRIKERDSIKRLFYGQKVQYTDQLHQKDSVSEVLSDFLGIIINPAHENLYKALQEQFHYEVQIDIPDQKRKVKTKKHTYIREIPQYLYFYINRTGYNVREKQALKNQQKLSFDFVIYLDRFMQKYKQQSSMNTPLIADLWKKKNQLQKKINAFDIFAKKLQECRQIASVIDGWTEKLPDQSEIDNQKQSIENQLKNIEKQLEAIESRKQKYCLMYIFVHRGDAVSGHYWGYGRNAESWYRFDINTKKMKEDDILHDLYMSGGTPYALVYVKQKKLPNITYNYYKDFSIINKVSLMDSTENIQHKSENSYIQLIPQGLKKVIIAQNIQLHQEFTKRMNFEITHKVTIQYLTRLNWVENQALQRQKNADKSPFKFLPSYDNFALYLWMKNQIDFSKYNIFTTALKFIANITTAQLIEDETLLNSIQKEFRKKIKKNKVLKHFCIEVQPVEGKKFIQENTNYLLEKQYFLIIIGLISAVNELYKCKIENKDFSQEKQVNVNKLLKRCALLIKVGVNNQSYIKHILKEFVALFILRFLKEKCSIKINEEELKTLTSQNLVKQLQLSGYKQNLSIEKGSINENDYFKSNKHNAKAQESWASEDIGKGPNRQLLEKKFIPVMQLLQTEVRICKKLQREGKVSKLNEKTGQIQDYNEIIQQKKNEESLI